MEAVIFEDSPLAEYLEGEATGQDNLSSEQSQGNSPVSSPTSSPSFAPRGRPSVQSKFRNKPRNPLRLQIPQNATVTSLHKTFSKALNSELGRVDNTRFLERFRYIIVASQLLNEYTYHGTSSLSKLQEEFSSDAVATQLETATIQGAVATALAAFISVWMLHWVQGGKTWVSTVARLVIVAIILEVLAVLIYAFIRRQRLQRLRFQILDSITNFVTQSQAFDSASAASITLVQEVELVSRGYRISSPLPPISRLEDRSQSRRCLQLRRILRQNLIEITPRYSQALSVMKPLADLLDLEKFYDVYDINDIDLQEAALGYSEGEFDDEESLRVIRVLLARFHTIRKLFLCCLLALEARGGKSDFQSWGIALAEINALEVVTKTNEERLHRVLGEQENPPVPATPKIPLTPNRERWRAQLRKLNALSTGIRSLQAKLHVLREESDRTLDESEDLSELAPNLVMQYDSIGVDLRALVQEWEAGKAALASNIDRNERRISSMSGIMSPTTSLGSPTDALKILNGEVRSRSSTEFSSSDAEEVFEAIAVPRQRSPLTREERIAQMREQREKKDSMREAQDANTRMFRELQSVIKLRPHRKTASASRVTSV